MKIEEYSRNFPHYYDVEVPKLLNKYLLKKSGGVFCDLGCGDGALLSKLTKSGIFGSLWKVFGTDLSDERLEAAKSVNTGVIFYKEDACCIKNLKEGSVDFLTSTQVIEHVDSDESMLFEIKRLLKAGGTAYISTVFKKKFGWYFYRNQGRWVLDPTHVREYTEDHQLLLKIERAGLTLVESNKTLFYFPLLDFFLKRLGSGRDIYSNRILRSLRNIKVPIPGYYLWEIVVNKKI